MKNLNNTTNKQANEVKASQTIILLSPFFEHQEQTEESDGIETKALTRLFTKPATSKSRKPELVPLSLMNLHHSQLHCIYPWFRHRANQ
jgi:hypothetical protein